MEGYGEGAEPGPLAPFLELLQVRPVRSYARLRSDA
jgi:hypothetical protein